MGATFALQTAWPLILRDLGVPAARVLRRADMPADLFSRPQPQVTADQYFRLWEAVVAELDDPDVALRIGQAVSVEMFDPPLFAALCSPDLATAADRLSRYKALVGPFTLAVEPASGLLSLTYGALGFPELPPVVAQTELVFLVSFVRLATRAPVRPVEVVFRQLPPGRAAFEAFFGVPVRQGPTWTVRFAELDARRPFLTASPAMWEAFEPALRTRLDGLLASATHEERVRAALLELLPSGRSAVADVSRALGLSARSLQRRLGEEGTTYQAVLHRTREALARHYLASTDLQSAEIAFLLGYDDPSSFFRAFHQWTGSAPGRVRSRR
ncbi:MAG: AraC family transcriptional regulator ligand-binding domain-containing protein [Myxococcota bacterium]